MPAIIEDEPQEEYIDVAEAPDNAPETNPEPEAETTPTPAVVKTMFGEVSAGGNEEEKLLLRIRNTITDALNRHARHQEGRAKERTPQEIERDPRLSYYAGLDEIDHGRKQANGLIQNDHSTLESIRQQIDTLQRMIRENKRKQ